MHSSSSRSSINYLYSFEETCFSIFVDNNLGGRCLFLTVTEKGTSFGPEALFSKSLTYIARVVHLKLKENDEPQRPTELPITELVSPPFLFAQWQWFTHYIGVGCYYRSVVWFHSANAALQRQTDHLFISGH